MANFPLEIIYPKAVGNAPDGLDSNNRCYFAYPGIEYNIQVCAIGGKFPFTYELANAPSGMTVSETGEISWPNPTTGTHSDIVVTVTDSEANEESETWSIVCGTSGWRFIATTGSDSNDGTINTPWQTIRKLYDSGSTNRIILREGTYNVTGFTVGDGIDQAGNQNGADNRIRWTIARPNIWMAYPGEEVTIDFGSDHADDDETPAFRFESAYTYVENITIANAFNKGFWVDRRGGSPNNYWNRGVHFRNVTFDTFGPAATHGEGDNAAAILYTSLYSGDATHTQAYGDVIYGCRFINPYGEGVADIDTPVAVKQYSWYKGLVANCYLERGDAFWPEALSPKAACTQVEFRQNVLIGAGIGGNFDDQVDTSSTEIRFNRISAPGQRGMYIWHGKGTNECDEVFIDRNTLQCIVYMDGVYTADGPYTFTNNVIVNEDGAGSPWPYLQDINIGDASRVSITTSATPTGTDNLAGNAAANIIDSNGLLQGSYRTSYFPGWGHELGEGEDPEPGETAKAAPVLVIGIL